MCTSKSDAAVVLLLLLCVCVYAYACHHAYMEVRGQPVGISLLLPCGSYGSNSDGQALCIYLLSHLTSSDSFKKWMVHPGQHPGFWVGSPNISPTHDLLECVRSYVMIATGSP